MCTKIAEPEEKKRDLSTVQSVESTCSVRAGADVGSFSFWIVRVFSKLKLHLPRRKSPKMSQ